ncbi:MULTISPECIES: MarR family winged helix-turn-helix transcriptional regulator [unclassified Microbacterium]|uniref:MarR family winged helix-turn-helix transcriptional regulator n=1 Tax=unclassified Microbacterium TaxID=2609290 RepID=UPI0012FA929B|nr:MarR family transcriptional regulator [Microbacterium sp. MAH-37]MVQ42249.1 MarR family transcriptional regulator [Microbacterium sp. MAH-37]
MDRDEIIPTLVLSSYALGRIAAQEARNDAPAAQWRVLSLLEESPAQRVGALAAAARTTQPGMTRLIGDLERAGLVARTPDPEDSRATLVTITGEGRRVMHAWRTDFRATLAPRFAGLDDADWAALARAAQILHDHSRETGDAV